MSNYTITIKELIDEGDDIFNFDYPYYNEIEGTKELFEEKFKNVFMFHEIGFDDVDVFKHYLKTKLITLYTYYYQLYQTELRCKDIDFMLNKDLKETFTREIIGSSNKEGEVITSKEGTINQTNTENINGSTTGTNTVNSNLTDNYSGTNDNKTKDSSVSNGVSSSELLDGYLTSVQNNEGNESYNLEEINTSTINNTESIENEKTNNIEENNSSTGTTTENEILTNNQTETTELLSQGNIGVTSSAELLEKWRRVLIDIDMMLINDLATLFLKVY